MSFSALGRQIHFCDSSRRSTHSFFQVWCREASCNTSGCSRWRASASVAGCPVAGQSVSEILHTHTANQRVRGVFQQESVILHAEVIDLTSDSFTFPLGRGFSVSSVGHCCYPLPRKVSSGSVRGQRDTAHAFADSAHLQRLSNTQQQSDLQSVPHRAVHRLDPSQLFYTPVLPVGCLGTLTFLLLFSLGALPQT